MISARISPKLENALDTIADRSGIPRSQHIRAAFTAYVENWTDYRLGISALARNAEPGRRTPYTPSAVRRRLGL